MKKNLFIAALLCSISFAGKAATNETKTAAVEKSVVNASPNSIKRELFSTTYACPNGAWSVIVYGTSPADLDRNFAWYVANANCS